MRVPLPPDLEHQRRALALAALSTALIGATACSAAETDQPPNDSATAPGDNAQEEVALQAYRDAQDLYINVLQGERELDEALPEMEQYATGEALDAFITDAEVFEEAGVTFHGTPSSTPEVTGLDTESDPAVATIADCWDDGAWTPVAESGQELEFDDELPERRVLNARAERHEHGWVLTEMSPEEDRTC